MKANYDRLGIGLLCGLFGKTRHAYYDHLWRRQDDLLKEDIVLQEVRAIRTRLPKIGTLKLHFMLQQELLSHGIKVGRDYLFDLLAEHRLLVRKRKRRIVTTNSRHWMKKYSNLVKDLSVNRPEQVWVSDITYIRTGTRWGYLSLITDAYSRKIMGYGFRMDLSTQGCLTALQMALNNRQYNRPLIHHSDRGSQYCSQVYTQLLTENNIAISMTENGDPYENALAERMSGILKEEFGLNSNQYGFDQTYKLLKVSIESYNELRPHASCSYLTPDQAHLSTKKMTKKWKNYKTTNNLRNEGVKFI